MEMENSSTKFCRFCFKQKFQQASLKETAELLGMTLFDLFNIFGLSHENYEIFPKSVCQSCLQEIQICVDFRNTVQKAEKEMIEHYEIDGEFKESYQVCMIDRI